MTTETEPTSIIIRSPGLRDIPHLVQQAQELAAFHGRKAQVTPDALRQDIFGPRPRAVVMVADAASKLAGFAAGYDSYEFQNGTPVFVLQNFHVSAAFRRHAVGTRLMCHIVGEAVHRGAEVVRLHVVSKNTPAIAFYEAAGFIKKSESGDLSSMVLRGKSLQKLVAV